jgi:type I restriction enzyme S subunit
MKYDLDPMLKSKRDLRRKLAEKPVAEKLHIVEKLAERALATRKDDSPAPPSEPWEIPSHWRWKKLGEVATIVGGGTPRTDRSEYFGGDIPWITPADLSKYDGKSISRGARSITKQGLEDSGAQLLPAGSVLFSSRAPIGYVAIAENPVTTNQGFKSLVLGDDLLPDFVYYYMKRARGLALSLASGTTFLEISGKKAAQIPFPVAPPDEQRRIVAEVEKQFTRLEAGVAALRRVQANLKRYRAAVLKAACEGRLVPTEAELARQEGRSYEPAANLLARIIAERRSIHERSQASTTRGRKRKYKEPLSPSGHKGEHLPDGWTWVAWDQIAYSQNGRPFPSAQYQSTGFKLLRPGNLHVSGKVVWTQDNTRCMPQKFVDENSDLIVRGRELVMNLTAQSLKDEFLGRVCLTVDREECLLNQRLARLAPIIVLPEFLLYLLKGWRFRRFVDGLNSGSLIQHMFTSQLARFTFPLPPLAEQARIVEEVERRLSVIERAEATVTANLRRAARLRQSILQQAFSGKLVTDDPEDTPPSASDNRLLDRRKNGKTQNRRKKR